MYLLFAWEDYEQSGGWGDYEGVYLSEEAAQEAFLSLVVSDEAGIYSQGEIVKLGELKRVSWLSWDYDNCENKYVIVKKCGE